MPYIPLRVPGAYLFFPLPFFPKPLFPLPFFKFPAGAVIGLCFNGAKGEGTKHVCVPSRQPPLRANRWRASSACGTTAPGAFRRLCCFLVLPGLGLSFQTKKAIGQGREQIRKAAHRRPSCFVPGISWPPDGGQRKPKAGSKQAGRRTRPAKAKRKAGRPPDGGQQRPREKQGGRQTAASKKRKTT